MFCRKFQSNCAAGSLTDSTSATDIPEVRKVISLALDVGEHLRAARENRSDGDELITRTEQLCCSSHLFCSDEEEVVVCELLWRQCLASTKAGALLPDPPFPCGHLDAHPLQE